MGSLKGKANVQPSVFMLNDDCLLQLIPYLNVVDQFNFSKVCKRFLNVYNLYFKSNYHSLNVNQFGSINFLNWIELLRQCGQFVSSFSICSNDTSTIQRCFIECLPRYCLDLNEINIFSTKLNFLIYDELSQLKNLKIIKLFNCSVRDSMILVLKKLCNLEYLDVTNSYKITGKYMKQFENLKDLVLENCESVKSEYFIEICKSTQLISLNVKGCKLLNESSFEALILYCKCLKILKIGTTNYLAGHFDNLGKIEQLEYLEIDCYGETLSDELFKNLAIYKSKQMKFLLLNGIQINANNKTEICKLKNLLCFDCSNDSKVDDDFLANLLKLTQLRELNISSCINVSDGGVLNFIRESRSLNTINISWCIQLTSDVILSSIDILKENKRNKLKFIATRCPMSSVLNHEKFVENKSLVQIECDIKYGYFEPRKQTGTHFTYF